MRASLPVPAIAVSIKIDSRVECGCTYALFPLVKGEAGMGCTSSFVARVLGICALASAYSLAFADELTDRAKRLLERRQAKEAYQLLLPQESARAGDPGASAERIGVGYHVNDSQANKTLLGAAAFKN